MSQYIFGYLKFYQCVMEITKIEDTRLLLVNYGLELNQMIQTLNQQNSQERDGHVLSLKHSKIKKKKNGSEKEFVCSNGI